MHKWEVYGGADHIGLTAKPLSWLKLSLFYSQSLFYFPLEVVILVVQK